MSEATVSRVLNDRPGVSQPTREAVLTALDVMGYERPTKLRGDRDRLVGLVLPELTNPIFPAFAEVIGGALAQQRFTPVLCTRTAGGVTEAEYIDLLLRQNVSGVIFAGGLYSERAADHTHFGRLAQLRLPTVLINAAVESIGFTRVSSDDAIAVEQGLRHLTALGHTRIGFLLGPRDHVPSERKLHAAARYLERAGTPLDEGLVAHSYYSLEAGQAAAKQLLARGATAILCASDPLALGAIRAAQRADLDVPRDVSVIGFDDSSLMNCTNPALTTIRQPIEPMGRTAVDLLTTMISGAEVGSEEILFEPELVVRQSTAAAPS